MQFKYLLILLFTTLFFSCETNKIIRDSDHLLVGNWSNSTYENETIIFKKVTFLEENTPGISFIENREFIERTSGWCGTPPLTFYDISGNWELNNSILKITTDSYLNNYNWRIISLTKEELVIKRELTAQEEDYQKLMTLFDQIQALSIGVSCSNSSNWTFTAFGSKACGGPKGFIPYSKEIDTDSFLQKIEEYTKLEKQYNIKWKIISTCDITNSPVEVECQNGYPTLKY